MIIRRQLCRAKGYYVKDLNLSGNISPTGSGSYVGSVAGSNSGKIENCTFNGMIVGTDHVGGIVGINTSSGSITQCSATGTVSGNHFVGGIAGYSDGFIRACNVKSQIHGKKP